MNSTIPRGIAKIEPSPCPPYGSRYGAALTNTPRMPAATQSVAASGDAPSPRRALTPPAPTMPPTLKRPWKPDIIGRLLARSTMTAWMFTTQSNEPTPAPKMNSAATSTGKMEPVASSGRVRQIIPAAAISTRRHPNRAASAPAGAMATIEPAPRQRSSSPSAPSPRPERALAKGTSGAQAATPRPAMKKTMRVERCSSRPGIVGARGATRHHEMRSTSARIRRPTTSGRSNTGVGGIAKAKPQFRPYSRRYATAHRLDHSCLHGQCPSPVSLGLPAVWSELSTICRAVRATCAGPLARVAVTGDAGSTQCCPLQGGRSALGVVGPTRRGGARLGQPSDHHR